MSKIRDFFQRAWYSLPLKTRDLLTRAAKTFAQTFIAAVPLATIVGADLAVVKATVIAAFSAAVSAAWNVLKTPSSGETRLVPIIVHPHPDDILPPQE